MTLNSEAFEPYSEPKHCGICGRLMDQDDPTTLDCGGDCLRCMAEAGDPDCIVSMRELEPDEPKWQPESDDQP